MIQPWLRASPASLIAIEPLVHDGPQGQLGASSQDILHDIPKHVGQPIVAPAVAVGQPRMVQPKQVQDRGVEIVHVDPVFCDRRADVVGRSVREAAFDSGARGVAQALPL